MIKKISKIFKFPKKEKPLEKQKIKKIKVGKYEIFANESHAIERYLRVLPLYNRNFERLVKYLFSKNKKQEILDIGSNIGDSLALIRSVGVKNKVHCVEGSKYFFDILCRNIEILKNASSYKTLLSDKRKRVNVKFVSETGTAKFVKQNETSITASSLDEFVDENRIRNIKLLKIDTDGYDLKILRGGQNFLSKNNPIIFFEYAPYLFRTLGDKGVDIFPYLKKLGYKYGIIYDMKGLMICSFDLSDTQILSDLDRYVGSKNRTFSYYDIALFPKKDERGFNTFLKSEREFLEKN